MAIQDKIFGKPLATSDERAEQIGVWAGIPIFGLDALTSAAYGPEAALSLLIPLGIIGTQYLLPIITAILILLVIVYFSYRQTIAAYPSGGGSFTVASENLGETVLANERDTARLVKTLGFKKAYDLAYRNHRLDEVSRTELRGRLIFLFRLLQVDTVFSYDPWGHYEENPDHYVTAQAVEAACWMSSGLLDFPEQFDAGLKPHAVSEKYYFARGPQLVNRVVAQQYCQMKWASERVRESENKSQN